MDKKNFLPVYSVGFANIWCEIDGVEIPFKLIDAGLSRVTICGESSDVADFSDIVSCKMIFKKQEFIMDLECLDVYAVGSYHHYVMRLSFIEETNFKRWLIFIKSIFSLYLKKNEPIHI